MNEIRSVAAVYDRRFLNAIILSLSKDQFRLPFRPLKHLHPTQKKSPSMNDEKIEQQLRELPAPELPASWRAGIVANAVRSARASEPTRHVWPAVLLHFRNLCLRNPVTASAMTALWILIFLFKATTPVDPQEKTLLAHLDPNRPVYFVSIPDQILLAQLAMDQADQRPQPQIP